MKKMLFIVVLMSTQGNTQNICSSSDLKQVNVARNISVNAIETALRFLNSDDASMSNNLKKWFGSKQMKTRKRVQETLRNIVFWSKNLSFKCHYSNDGGMVKLVKQPNGSRRLVDSSGSLFAYVYPAELNTVYLGLAFFEAQLSSGFDTKFGTIIHEMSHFWVSGNTNDVEYGRNACLDLAKNNPSQTLSNADSYQYFIEDFLQ